MVQRKENPAMLVGEEVAMEYGERRFLECNSLKVMFLSVRSRFCPKS
jgi:hypothetical protein